MCEYGDYKCGAISYREYCALMAEQERMEKYDQDYYEQCEMEEFDEMEEE